MMRTSDIELRTESRRKAVMLNRIAQPQKPDGAWIFLACVLGVIAAVALGIIIGGCQ